ncbi:transporter, partial [Klebsiella pneumoniae]|nr:transporter [Klebsiella pneumoniae]
PKDALTFDIKNIFVGGIGVTQPIFMGFKVRELYNITKSSERISKIAYDNEKTELIISVDQAYWTVVSLINKKNLATKYVELLQTL